MCERVNICLCGVTFMFLLVLLCWFESSWPVIVIALWLKQDHPELEREKVE